MHTKFLSQGRGSGKQAVSYLMGDLDHQGNERSYVGLVEGDPEMVSDIIDSLPFALRYRSAVVAWHRDDNPTMVDILDYLQDFKKLAFAGLQPQQYSLLAVMHLETNGATHLHILVPRVDLLSGKSMNISPPGWQKGYYALRDMWNIRKGWARPDDPLRARPTVNPGNNLPEVVKRIKAEVNESVAQGVEDGSIASRSDVLNRLSVYGSIQKLEKESISIKLAELERPVKFAGSYFCEDYDFQLRCRPAAPRPSPKEQYAQAMEEYRLACKKREAYNLEHYPSETPLDILIRENEQWVADVVSKFKPKPKPPRREIVPPGDDFLTRYLEDMYAQDARMNAGKAVEKAETDIADESKEEPIPVPPIIPGRSEPVDIPNLADQIMMPSSEKLSDRLGRMDSAIDPDSPKKSPNGQGFSP